MKTRNCQAYPMGPESFQGFTRREIAAIDILCALIESNYNSHQREQDAVMMADKLFDELERTESE